MKKSRKRTVALLLSILMVLALVPGAAWANGESPVPLALQAPDVTITRYEGGVLVVMCKPVQGAVSYKFYVDDIAAPIGAIDAPDAGYPRFEGSVEALALSPGSHTAHATAVDSEGIESPRGSRAFSVPQSYTVQVRTSGTDQGKCYVGDTLSFTTTPADAASAASCVWYRTDSPQLPSSPTGGHWLSSSATYTPNIDDLGCYIYAYVSVNSDNSAYAGYRACSALVGPVEYKGELARHTLTVTGGEGSGTYAVGATVSVQWTNDNVHRFVRWNATGLEGVTDPYGGELDLTENYLSFRMPDHDVTLTAVTADPIVTELSVSDEDGNTLTAVRLVAGTDLMILPFAETTPYNASDNVTFSWTSTDETVAQVVTRSVEVNGQTGDYFYITALKSGSATLIGTASMKNEAGAFPTVSLKVTVTDHSVSAVTVSGDAKQGVALTANVTLSDGSAANSTKVSYQWQSAEENYEYSYEKITGATGATYTPTKSIVGRYIRVVVTGKGDYAGSATSAPTAKVVDSATDIQKFTLSLSPEISHGAVTTSHSGQVVVGTPIQVTLEADPFYDLSVYYMDGDERVNVFGAFDMPAHDVVLCADAEIRPYDVYHAICDATYTVEQAQCADAAAAKAYVESVIASLGIPAEAGVTVHDEENCYTPPEDDFEGEYRFTVSFLETTTDPLVLIINPTPDPTRPLRPMLTMEGDGAQCAYTLISPEDGKVRVLLAVFINGRLKTCSVGEHTVSQGDTVTDTLPISQCTGDGVTYKIYLLSGDCAPLMLPMRLKLRPSASLVL